MTMWLTIRDAYRSIVRAPAVNLLIITSLAAGISRATTVFGWVEHLVRRPLPAVDRIDRLVSVVSRIHGREDSVSYPDYSPALLLRMILGEGLWQGVAGAVAGSLLAVLGTNLIASQPPRIVAADPAIIGSSAALRLVVAIVAALAPGLRATRVAPASALKIDG